ncbi:MAG: outer membrane beta-barrel protein [Rhodobacteraceae bacterium]|nr:outer membrane beta-barrel protein [Paracoccaceae bacterium]
MKSSVAALAALALCPAAAQAQDWQFQASLYGWFPALDITLDTPRGQVDASYSIQDVLDNLSGALMGTFEARTGRWGFFGDLFYSDLSPTEKTPFGQVFSEAKVETKLTMFSGYAAYRVWDTPQGTFDFAGGFRAFWLNTDTTLRSDVVPDQHFSSDNSWVDPIVAARAMVNINDQWFVTALADGGGYFDGSSSTWQIYGAVGYRFNPTWSMQFGYRYMNIEKELGGNDTSLALSGPLIGVSARF